MVFKGLKCKMKSNKLVIYKNFLFKYNLSIFKIIMTTPPPINSKDVLNKEQPIIISTEKNKIKIDISYNELSIGIKILKN